MDMQHGKKRISMATGDFLFMPRAPHYRMHNNPCVAPVDLDEISSFFALQRMQGFSFVAGEGDVTARLLNGKFSSARTTLVSWLAFFPQALILDARTLSVEPNLKGLVDLLFREIPNGKAGSHLVIERLVNVLLIYALRYHQNAERDRSFFPLCAYLDSQIGPFLRLMHDKPEAPWKLDQMAKQSGMSRSVFVDCFRQLLGEPPGAYLPRIRLTRAVELLRETSLSVVEIAGEAGYRDEFAFRRAFRRVWGIPPASFRRNERFSVQGLVHQSKGAPS